MLEKLCLTVSKAPRGNYAAPIQEDDWLMAVEALAPLPEPGTRWLIRSIEGRERGFRLGRGMGGSISLFKNITCFLVGKHLS